MVDKLLIEVPQDADGVTVNVCCGEFGEGDRA
jgi:hypothetical protein